ncbi:hypothetical protein BGZ74_001444 [Mortierella antarctica]|nr:hypothetical protein BGZ74_001444 [Mortierella antarctica]
MLRGWWDESEAAIVELRVLQAGERQEEEGLKRYRVEHSDHLVVPSVNKLFVVGRWIMSYAVLETMLGRVFRNSMPRVEDVHSGSPFDVASLGDEHKLQPQACGMSLPFRNDARTWVRYRFAGHQTYLLAPSDGSEAQPAQEEEIPVLGLVITNLAIQRELETLASLLRVNKYVCLATLPILYEDPFIWFQDQQFRRSYTSSIPVVRLLLSSVPNDSYSGLVKAMYGIGDEEPALRSTHQIWPIDYLSFVRHFNPQDQNSKSLLADLVTYVKMGPQLKSYVEEHKLAEKYAALVLKLDLQWYPYDDNEEDPITIDFLTLDIHREATWALCSPILEQLQSIVIPLSDIGRYLDSIARFSSLSVITFKLDEYCDNNEPVTGEEEIKKLRGLKEKRKQDLESAVKFVQLHIGMFRTLKQVLCPTTRSSWQFTPQSCPEEYLDRMLECLPTLIDPAELVNDNWKQFISKAEQTNLEFVKKIEELKTKPFLHRCSSLREYNMISLGPDSFKWAAQKKIVRDHEQEQDGRPTANLPPLEVVAIRAIGDPFGSELDDIGLSFGTTLKSFTAQRRGPFQEQTQTPQTQRSIVGRGWKMPLLSKLELDCSTDGLVLDPDFLRHCPSLQKLSLSDSLPVNYLNRIKPSRPAQLPELTALVLSGSAALAFHPDTLHSTKELKALILGSMPSCERTVLPSLQDAAPDDHEQDIVAEDSNTTYLSIQRLKWTWDYHLSSLHTLQLTFEFAHHFRFQMLRGTPCLRELCLSLYSRDHPVERVLTEADFTVDPLQWSQEQEDRGDDSGIEQHFKDPAREPSLHNQSLDTLSRIISYLHMVDDHRRETMSQDQSGEASLQRQQEQTPLPAFAHDPVWMEHQLRMSREILMSIGSRGRELQLDGSLASIRQPSRDSLHWGKTEQELAQMEIQNIEELVANETYLQPYLDAVLAGCQEFEARKKQEEEDLKKYRAEHPEHLAMPSVRKLEMYGRWSMSDETPLSE